MSFYLVSKVFTLYLLLFCNKKLAPGVIALKTEKLNECDRCKVLTDSFSYWLKKTSRGKYEGGDTAWEEAKLKSYARSEMRFVEIQEGLCSEVNEHQNDCYILAEEAEQVLEKWWFSEDSNTMNLHTWLCIDTLKHCCPSNHFGEFCAPCPVDKDNKICSSRGKCDGDGTRNGKGSCLCNRGYSGNYCEECSKNYYAIGGFCKQCDHACDGCTSSGPAACQNCKTGWILDSGICTDIDECAYFSTCKSDQYCINKEGSYNCQTCDNSCLSCIGAGPLNCTSCVPSKLLWKGKCITEEQKTTLTKSAVFRMTFYIGMFVLLGVLFWANRRIAMISFIIFAIFIYYTEISLDHVNTFDVYFKNYVEL